MNKFLDQLNWLSFPSKDALITNEGRNYHSVTLVFDAQEVT